MRQFHSEEIKPEELKEQIAHEVEEFQKAAQSRDIKKQTNLETEAVGIEVDKDLLEEAQELTKRELKKKQAN